MVDRLIFQGIAVLCRLLLILQLFHTRSSSSSPLSGSSSPPNFGSHIAVACFAQSRSYLNLTCPDSVQSPMVRIDRVTYGYAPDGNCLPLDEHCKYEENSLEMYSCVGHPSCSINLPAGGAGRELRSCNGHRSTYMMVHYQCIPSSLVVDVCSTSFLSSQWGFLSSPRYPLNYLPSAHCSLHLSTSHPSQRLHISLLDLQLQNHKAECLDWLQLFDGHRSETTCSQRSSHIAMTTFENWIDIEFFSDDAEAWKGFWIYYEAFPYIDNNNLVTSVLPTSPTTDTKLPTTRVTQPYQNTMSSTASKVTNKASALRVRHHATNSLTVGIVVGVVLGILLCISVVLAAVVFLRKNP